MWIETNPLNEIRSWLTDRLHGLNKKTTAIVIAVAIFYTFGDTLLPHVGHFIHLVLEVIESTSEHLLQHVFGLTHHSAEMVTAYTGLFVAIYLANKLLRKIRTVTRQVLEKTKLHWSHFRAVTRGHWYGQLGVQWTTAIVAGLVFYLMF